MLSVRSPLEGPVRAQILHEHWAACLLLAHAAHFLRCMMKQNCQHKHPCWPAPQVKMCLVINKIDRLVLETRLTPAEAYERLKVR